MSFAAIRWALAQPIAKASHKFVLVAMGSCVNANGREWLAWPSYRHVATITSLDHKTVEAAVYWLRENLYLIDTGKKRGETGKVVVYQLNTPENGVVISDPEGEGGAQLQHANDPEFGVVKSDSNDPVFPCNPPKFPTQSPQISHITTPKTGSGISNRTSNRTKKESGDSALARPPDVSESVWRDWTALRRKKRTTVDETVLKGARKEAALANMPLERFLEVWCLRGSQGLEAAWLKPEERRASPNKQEALEAANNEVARRFLERDTYDAQ